jgi:osmoprotectant transport system permease protein
VLYALPGLALFVVLIAYTGLTDTTVMIPLGIYSLAAIFPSVVDGLRSVPEPVRQAAIAMGFGTWRRLITVELPVAIPVIIAGLRVATVSSISLVSVGGLIGIGGLGYLFIDGEQRDFPTEIVWGIVLIVLLALVSDTVLVAVRRLLTPWLRGRAVATRSRTRQLPLLGVGGRV